MTHSQRAYFRFTNARELEKTVALATPSSRILAVPTDVSKPEAVQALFARTKEAFGRLDVLFNNAGTGAPGVPMEELTYEQWSAVVGVNLTGAFNVGQASARAMVARGSGGRIVFTSSVHVQMPFATMAVYGATKQGVRALCEAMAIELAPHAITVNHIGPGWVLSALNDPSPALEDDELLRDSLAQIPLGGRAADPRELGRAVVYLASSDGDYVTAEYLRVDGGFAVGKFA